MQADLTFTPELFSYLEKISLNEPQAQKNLRFQVEHLELAAMQISPLQSQLLRFLLSLSKSKKCLEIGTYCGYSALTIAQTLPSDGHLHTCDINIKTTKIAKKVWQEANVANKITLHLTPAIKTLTTFCRNEPNSFDFIFIDADKTQYPSYYLLAKDLLKSGGLIIIDNITWQGKIVQKSYTNRQIEGIRHCNAMIQQDDSVVSCIIPLGDGMFLIQKKMP